MDNEYIGCYENSNRLLKVNKNDKKDKIYFPYLSGEVIYQLRCSLFNEGNTIFNFSKIKNKLNKIDKFDLLIEENNEFDIYVDESGYELRDGKPFNKVCKVSIQDVSNKICWVGENYYYKKR